MKLYLETVSNEMMALLKELMTIEELKPFRLVGGTALALQFGHRRSIDIDLFAGGRVEIQGLPKKIASRFPDFVIVSQNQNGFTAVSNNIKVDIVDWKAPFAQEPIIVDNIRMATAQDIFANKCEALLDRKAEKDFVDISVIASHYELRELLVILRTRYSFISTGAITPFLVRRDLISRDATIQYLQGLTFNDYADNLEKRILEFEQSVKDLKQIEINDRAKKIQNLINKKRNKK